MDNQQLEVKSSVLENNSLLDGRYLIIKKLATGGMGNIYKAQDIKNNNFCLAIKVLHKAYNSNAQVLERFKREVSICQKVSHPNVVKIFDLSISPEITYFTMEMIEGQSLEQRLGRGVLAPKDLPRAMIEILDGLRAIHNAGIVHRDLKPGNIMMQVDGSMKIIDFGISRTEDSRLTSKNVRVGSLFYIPPELWLGSAPSPTSDLYSLGCLFYELCTGAAPFISKNPMELLELHQKQELKKLPEQYPSWISAVIRWLMAKQLTARPKHAGKVIDYIQRVLPESQSIQTFAGPMQQQTIRSGQGMISTFGHLSSGHVVEHNHSDLRKTLMFSLEATRPAYETPDSGPVKKPRSRTIILKLPNKSALVFEFQLPSKDFLFLGIFLLSLNIFDWYLTHQGISFFGVHAEGNGFLKSLILKIGLEKALLLTKGTCIFIVLALTIMARRSKAVKNIVGTLSMIYLNAAVIPWIYILYYR